MRTLFVVLGATLFAGCIYIGGNAPDDLHIDVMSEADEQQVDASLDEDAVGEDERGEDARCENGTVTWVSDGLARCVSQDIYYYATTVLTGKWEQTFPLTRDEFYPSLHYVEAQDEAVRKACFDADYVILGLDPPHICAWAQPGPLVGMGLGTCHSATGQHCPDSKYVRLGTLSEEVGKQGWQIWMIVCPIAEINVERCPDYQLNKSRAER